MVPELQKNSLKNFSVLITGGGSGIGKAAALSFKQAGAKVVIAGRDLKKLKVASKEIGVDFFQVKVEDIKSVKKLVSQVVKKNKAIDVLINCAGVYGPIGKFAGNNIKEWQEALAINLLGTANMCHAVLPVMLKKGRGKIINLSGGGAVQPFENFSAYATSKAAVVRLTENLAVEYKNSGIQINAIAPGAINTKFLERVLKAGPNLAGETFYKKSIEQKKSGGDSVLAATNLMLFLCMPKNQITGKLIAAKWDNWPHFTSALNNTNQYTLRRVDNKYFKEI
jgi:3-oxoacyl-[acyl-carrier protein] reductase